MKKDKERNKKIDLIIKIVLIIIIILLLIHNCVLRKKQDSQHNLIPNGNVDIIDIKCDDDNKCKPVVTPTGKPNEIQSVSFAQKIFTIKKGDKQNLIAIIKPSSLSGSKLIWKSSDSSVVTVDANGKIAGLKEGKAIITVTSPNGKTATCVVKVVADQIGVKTITLDPDKNTLETGETGQIIAVIEPVNATNRELVWSSSDSSVATVDSKGVIKGLKSGTVTITAKTKDGKVVGTTTITVKVIPTPTPKVITSLSFAQDNISIKKGNTLGLVVEVEPTELSNTELTWTSSDPSIVKIDENGKITGVKEGTATITVTSPNGKKATCTVNVTVDTIEVKKIDLKPNKKTLEAGETGQITAIIEPENATNRELVWSSSDSSIATVDSKGVIKGIKEGTVTITAKTKDGKVVGTTTITVKVAPTPTPTPKVITSLSFAQDNINIKKGNTLGLVVEVTPTELSNTKLTWTSSDPSIVKVDENGKITGVKEGSATITVTSPNGKKATCTVNVTTDTIEVEEITLIPDKTTLEINETGQITAIIEPENATNRELVWSSSDSSVVTVDSNGIIKGIKEGTVTVTAKTKDGKVVGTTTITVEDETFKIYDNDHDPLTWNGADDLKIFTNSMYGAPGVIAPESSNTYQFVIKNSTKYNIKYSIKFIETNDYHINMKYKLKKNDTYIISEYVYPNQLDINNYLLDSSDSDTYYLEWKWVSSDNDTEIGKDPNSNYGLKIKVEAESVNE